MQSLNTYSLFSLLQKASNKNTALVDVNTVAVRKGQIIRALCGRAPNPGSASITTPSTVEQKRRLGSDQKGREVCNKRAAAVKKHGLKNPDRWPFREGCSRFTWPPDSLAAVYTFCPSCPVPYRCILFFLGGQRRKTMEQCVWVCLWGGVFVCVCVRACVLERVGGGLKKGCP